MTKKIWTASAMGKKGGAVRSAAKKQAAVERSKLENFLGGHAKRIYPRCTKVPPYRNGAHRFSARGRCYGCGYQR